MAKDFQVAAFEGGKLRVLDSGVKSREAVLALPMSRLLLCLVRVPVEADIAETVTPVVKALSPYPDDPLAVSFEKIRETEHGTVVLAGALPEGAADDVAEALDAAKLNVVRVDALELGGLRGLWSQLAGEGRRLVLVDGVDCLSLFVLDGDQPSALRALSSGADLRREAMLSLLEAEDFGGARTLDEVVLVHVERPADLDDEPSVAEDAAELADEPPGTAEAVPPRLEQALTLEAVRAALGDFTQGTMRELTVGTDAALLGVAERAAEPDGLDALPDSWRAVLEETRFKAKLTRNLIVAGAVWTLAMGVLFGVPFAYGYLTDRTKGQCRRHAQQYKTVADMKAKVGIIEKYSDHARGELELMKAISDRMPQGIVLTAWDFRRGEGLTVRGESEGSSPVYQLKDAVVALKMETADGEAGEKIFNDVQLGPLHQQSDGKQRFDMKCTYEGVEE